MELLECIINCNNNVESVATLVFNKSFKKIKIMTLTNNKKKTNTNINEMHSECIEIKFSKEKKEVNIDINPSDCYIFIIMKVDNNIIDKTYIIDTNNKLIHNNTNNSENNLKEDVGKTKQEDVGNEGIIKILKRGFSDKHNNTSTMDNINIKECSLKNENIFAYIKRKIN